MSISYLVLWTAIQYALMGYEGPLHFDGIDNFLHHGTTFKGNKGKTYYSVVCCMVIIITPLIFRTSLDPLYTKF